MRTASSLRAYSWLTDPSGARPLGARFISVVCAAARGSR
jgi:hypothetical protein